ncbi:hypothetical protein ACIQXV_17190 [Neobacillus sp. NPDC097160]|uniref:hypothetical protein n=1 Tax=Neobacillus sp. NPDC097160 TaxID=3364298 RepID=UPI00380D5957
MKPGEKKNFVLIPFLGLIEAGDTKKETMERIERARADKEIADKKTLRRLRKKFPNCTIVQDGLSWNIIPREDVEL